MLSFLFSSCSTFEFSIFHPLNFHSKNRVTKKFPKNCYSDPACNYSFFTVNFSATIVIIIPHSLFSISLSEHKNAQDMRNYLLAIFKVKTVVGEKKIYGVFFSIRFKVQVFFPIFFQLVTSNDFISFSLPRE